jgi:hypothetical protein
VAFVEHAVVAAEPELVAALVVEVLLRRSFSSGRSKNLATRAPTELPGKINRPFGGVLV